MNLNGDEEVKTVLGGLFSLFVIIILVFYGSLKFSQMVTRAQPQVNDTILPSHLENSETLNLNEINFKFAFTINNFQTGVTKDDPHYVKWIARLWIKKDGVESERILKHHVCTENELKEFQPVSKKSDGEF